MTTVPLASQSDPPWLRAGFALVLLALVVSYFGCADVPTWIMETAPVMIALPLLWLTRRRWPLTTLLYALIALHCLVLILGGHYTYAKVPLGFWMQDWFGYVRNQYDRIGHFVQGFVPALIAREIIVRASGMKPGALLGFLAIASAMFVSSTYEIIEMIAGRVSAEAAAAFLGTQGDNWDTQMDMTLALIGALVALLTCSRLHERGLARLGLRTGPAPG